MGTDDTLSYVGDTRGDSSLHVVAPYLVIALECHRPLAWPARLGLATVQEVRLGRAAARSHARERHEGVHLLEIGLPDSWMSSAHATVRRDGAAWMLTDGGSKNGTFLNGRRCRSARVADGDLIEVGSTLILFRDPPTDRLGDRVDVTEAELEAEPEGLRTVSPLMAARLRGLARVAGADIPVVLHGETGTGKEVVARAIHRMSNRSGSFVAVNCGALPATLIESELFGHRQGAFSGATADRPGLVRSADRGTLFLDEVAELPAPSQIALLRVLQEREVRPVGGTAAVPVDLRVIAATHQDLPARVEAGSFREDLYARVAGITVTLPPLRERREDLGLLLRALLPAIAGPRADGLRLSREAGRALIEYAWPRNVRELEHALRAAVALADDTIEVAHLPEPVGHTGAPAAAEDPADQALREQLLGLLEQEAGNVRAVARALGKAPVQIYRWCKRLAIDLDRYR
ncbi:MAG TPA: sigma 54-interacting transcriptional regulator [Kofleriaceae bacterium]|nr:sigma 54-interacting transcriptional regulator [Kofleriaceae bacterium]